MQREWKSRFCMWSTVILAAGVSPLAAQFPGFTSGNIVVSRSVYTGDASIFAVGQPLPPVCPSTASCGTGKATDSGAYPSTTSSNNVWNNDAVDGSFGVTSPIFLDQLTPTGTVVNTLAIPPNMVSTSFSSKSEMALNLSTDGTAITFMAYVAPPNTVDVSNANTPGAYDPTNPSGGSYYRAVVQVGANGAIQVTPTNSYSGNNGRAAILSNGIYYMSGNSNNGSGTPANIISTAGVQMAMPGQTGAAPAVQIGNFSITQVNNPSTGQPYAADKAGKDNNFRGLTIFNNTLYVTKGSGGNGIDTVYQVGTAGTLPTAATAATAPITVLPGFPTVSAKNIGATDDYPFGIFFANANTLYVADEGDGVVADAATSPSAGLQKWVFSGTMWTRVYVLQNGLNLGKQYSVSGYPTAINPATAGLRNLAGKLNGDGTVTLWAVTSTVSANGDQGADPNKLVSITDTIANMNPTVAAQEQFTVIKSAAAGEVLRGVALAPTAGSSAAQNAPLIISAASTQVTSVAAGGLAFAVGQGLASGNPPEILGPAPTEFDGTSISIKDSTGATTSAPLLFVSPWELTFQVPASVAPGVAQVSVTSGASTQAVSNVQVAAVAPSVFSLNGLGLAAAAAVRVSNGTQIVEPAYTLNSFGTFTANPINMGSGSDQVYLTLYGTGIQAAGASKVTVTVNGVNAPVLYAGSGGFTGVDQVNVQLPSSLAGTGNVNVQLTAGGVLANQVQITIQ